MSEEINAVKISELEKRMGLLFETSQTAIKLASNDLKTRLDNMNEFRQTLKDQSSTFITKNEYTYVLKDIRELRESRAELHGRATVQSVIWSYVLAILGLLMSILSLLIRWGGVRFNG